MKFLSKIYIFLFMLSVIQLNAQDYQARQKKLEGQEKYFQKIKK